MQAAADDCVEEGIAPVPAHTARPSTAHSDPSNSGETTQDSVTMRRDSSDTDLDCSPLGSAAQRSSLFESGGGSARRLESGGSRGASPTSAVRGRVSAIAASDSSPVPRDDNPGFADVGPGFSPLESAARASALFATSSTASTLTTGELPSIPEENESSDGVDSEGEKLPALGVAYEAELPREFFCF